MGLVTVNFTVNPGFSVVSKMHFFTVFTVEYNMYHIQSVLTLAHLQLLLPPQSCNLPHDLSVLGLQLCNELSLCSRSVQAQRCFRSCATLLCKQMLVRPLEHFIQHFIVKMAIIVLHITNIVKNLNYKYCYKLINNNYYEKLS